MNIVFVKHDTAAEFAFKVPDEMAEYIHKGQTVFVKTMRGLCEATTTTNVISGDGAIDIAMKNGAYQPLKPVVGFIPESYRQKADEAIRQEAMVECRLRVDEAFKELFKELPF